MLPQDPVLLAGQRALPLLLGFLDRKLLICHDGCERAATRQPGHPRRQDERRPDDKEELSTVHSLLALLFGRTPAGTGYSFTSVYARARAAIGARPDIPGMRPPRASSISVSDRACGGASARG